MDETDGKDPGAIAGGKARAAALTPGERKAIARQGAAARWKGHEKPANATHEGTLEIGNMKISCAVLEDGRRVLSQRGVGRVLGRKRGGSDWKAASDAGGNLPFFLVAADLKPFISEEMLVAASNPLRYRHSAGGGVAFGVEATLLPQLCEVWLRAREAGALRRRSQQRIAQQAEIVTRGLAHVGITALVDEATGYQYDRARQALAEILEKFVRKELAAWARTFPSDYYEELFRLRNLAYDEVSSKRPPLVGKDTRDVVYKRLAPGVLDELERLNPRRQSGQRRAKHFQWLTTDVGHPKLKEHLIKVTTLMKAAADWADFKRMLDRALPKQDLPLLEWAAKRAEGGR